MSLSKSNEKLMRYMDHGYENKNTPEEQRIGYLRKCPPQKRNQGITISEGGRNFRSYQWGGESGGENGKLFERTRPQWGVRRTRNTMSGGREWE